LGTGSVSFRYVDSLSGAVNYIGMLCEAFTFGRESDNVFRILLAEQIAKYAAYLIPSRLKKGELKARACPGFRMNMYVYRSKIRSDWIPDIESAFHALYDVSSVPHPWSIPPHGVFFVTPS
jgi:hypothetical protein